MPLLTVMLVIIIVGILLALANKYAPMESTTKSLLNVVVIIALVFWILFMFFPGTMHNIENIRVGR